MTELNKLAMLRVLVDINDESEDENLSVYLSVAGDKILRKAYPFDSDITEVPNRYSYLQCELAAYLWNKRGAEGEISHNENGISRSYESADIPQSILREITPFCKVLKRGGNNESVEA